MTILVVQTSTVGIFNGASLQATTTLTSVVAGNAIIAICGHADFGGSGPSISCNDGSAYNTDVNFNELGGSTVYIGSLYAVGAGTHAVVATASSGLAANSWGGVIALEVSGLLTNGFDQSATGGGNSTGPATSAATGALAQANELIIACLAAADLRGSTTPPTGGPGTFTDANNSRVGFGDWDLAWQIQTSGTSAITVTGGTLTNFNKWAVGVGTYKGLATAFPVGGIIT